MSLTPWSLLRGIFSSISRLQLHISACISAFRAFLRYQLIKKTEYPLVTVLDRPCLDFRKTGNAIPPIVVQTWVSRQFGRTHSRSLLALRDLNPNLDFILLDDSESASYINEAWRDHLISDIYHRGLFTPLKADIFRYCWLYENGGYYFDISKGCSVALGSLHRSSDRRLLSYEDGFCNILPELNSTQHFQHPNRYLIQWGFGFAPKDPILKRVIDLICAYYPLFKGKVFEDPKPAILAFTGPGMFTKAVREVVQQEGRLEGAQAGINFNGHGIPWMPGSEVRYHLSPPYVLARSAVIVT